MVHIQSVIPSDFLWPSYKPSKKKVFNGSVDITLTIALQTGLTNQAHYIYGAGKKVCTINHTATLTESAFEIQ